MMNSGQRTAVSLLITVVLFAGFLMLCLPTPGLGLLDKLEEKFYSEKRIEECNQKLESVGETANSYIYNDLFSSFEALSRDDSVLSYFSDNPTPEEQLARENAKGKLGEKLAFDMRVIDADGRKLHHSTFAQDKIKQSNGKTTYKVYRDVLKDEEELALDQITGSPQLFTINKTKNQLIYSYQVPEKGNIVFYVNPSVVRDALEKADVIPFGQTMSMYVAADGTKGFVVGIPRSGTDTFEKPVLEKWNALSEAKPEQILEYSDKNWSLLTLDHKTIGGIGDSGFVISGVFETSYFELPDEISYLLYICFCITFFLVIFLLASARHDDMVVIRSRVKKLQNAFISEYLDNKESVDWAKVLLQIESRRGEFYEDVKRSLGRKGKKHSKELDACFEKTWDEILSVIGKNERKALGNDIEEFKKILEQALSGGTLQIESKNLVNVSSPEISKSAVEPVIVPVTSLNEAAAEPETLEDVEELDDIEEIEEIEEVEEAEELDEVEEIEEVAEAEELAEVEEIEEIEEAEELDEVEEIEEVKEAEGLDEVEEIEEVEEAEELAEVEEIEEVAEAEELDEVDEIEEVEETVEEVAEELPETEEVVEEVTEELPEPEETVEEVAEELPETEEVVEEVTEELPETEEPVEEVAEELPETEEVVEEVAEDLPETEDPVEEVSEELPETEETVEEVAEELPEPEEVVEEVTEELPETEETVEDVEETEEDLLITETAPTIVDTIDPLEESEYEENVESLDDLDTEAELFEEVDSPEAQFGPAEDEPAIIEISAPEEVEEIEDLEVTDFEELAESISHSEDSSVDNATFHKSDENFATVDSIFAEELTFGLSYTGSKNEDPLYDTASLNFFMEDPDFGEDEELLPLENPELHKMHFSMVGFGANNNSVTDLEGDDSDPIVEKNGVYSIAENLVLPKMELDADFKKLVDSVI